MKRLTGILFLIPLAVTAAVHAGPPGGEPVLIPTPDIPNVAIRILFETGSGDDPPGREGVCALAARWMARGGTEDHERATITDSLYPLAATVDVQVDKDYTVFLAHVPSSALVRFYPVFRDLLTRPRWDGSDFLREKEDASNHIENVLPGSDEELGKAALESFLYFDGPYGHPTRGTTSSIDGLTPEETRDFARSHFTRARLRIGIAGHYPETFPRLVITDMGTLPEGTPRRNEVPEPPLIDHVEILLAEKKAAATAISIGCPIDVKRGDPDYWPLLVATHWFGEHRTFFGHLMNVMRVSRGLNYGDYAYMEAFRQDGWTRFPLPNIQRRRHLFSIWIRPVEPTNAHFALRQAVREMEKLVDGGIPEDEFEEAKIHLRNYSQLWRQSLHRRLGMAMDDAITATGDYVEELAAALESMEASDVRQALERHLQAENLKVAIVCAEASNLAAAIRGNAPSPIHYAGDVPEQNRREDAEIRDHTLNVTRTEIVPADEIFSEKRTW